MSPLNRAARRGMTLTEKILAHHAIALERPFVAAGDVIRVRVDWTMASEIAWAGMSRTYESLDRPALYDASRFYLAVDHTVDPGTLAHSEKARRLNQLSHAFAAEAKLEHFYGPNRTIMHTTFYRDLVLPGQLVLGADSHTTSHGAVGAVAIGLGGADVTAAMVLGESWLEVPRAIRVEYTGELPFGVTGKDVILRTLGALGRNTSALERSVEFCGEGARHFSPDTRFAICNMTAELGGLNGIFEPDEVISSWLTQIRRRSADEARFFKADEDADYAARIPIPLAALEPQVARPSSPDNVVPARELEALAMQGCFIGACTTTEEDLVLGALVLEQALAAGLKPVAQERGRRIMVPGNLDIHSRLAASGLLAVYERAGFEIDPPGCSMCLGLASRRAGAGENWLTSQNRNFPNRMGPGSIAWLASAATVAASALTMTVRDPRPYLARVDRARFARLLERPLGPVTVEVTTSAPDLDVVESRANTSSLLTTPTSRERRGRAQLFGDSVDTDAMIAAEFCHLQGPAELGPLCFKYARPDFVERVRQGQDIIVAGDAWGTGSSREQAVWALMGAGVRAIVAKSFAFIHKRNLVNEALPFIIVEDPEFFLAVRDGAELIIDADSGELTLVEQQRVFRGVPASKVSRLLQDEGGLVPAIRRRGRAVFEAIGGA